MEHIIEVMETKRLLIIRILIGGFFIVSLAQTACTQPFSTPEIVVISATPSHDLETPSSTPLAETPIPRSETPQPTNNPAPTQVPIATITPLVTYLSVNGSPFFDSWSPDSQWIAFWLVEYGGDELPGSLAFVRVASGDVCLHPNIITEGVGTGQVQWQNDGSVQVVINPSDKTFTGAPCGDFVESGPLLESAGKISPDGRYLAASVTGEFAPGGYPITTTITDLSSDQIIASVSWEFAMSDAVGGGPQWLNSQIYLIGPALNQGFLYFSLPDGVVRKVVTDLLHLDNAYVQLYRSIFSQVDPATGEFHLLLKWEGGPPPLPLLLYHSELDEVETLPFYSPWPFVQPGVPGFSPEGGWLLLGDPVEGEPFLENVGGDYWIRPMDSPGSVPIQLPEGMFLGALSPGAQQFAVLEQGHAAVNILEFPGNNVSSRWAATGYKPLVLAGWSPDGRHLAIIGFLSESNQSALFVLEP